MQSAKELTDKGTVRPQTPRPRKEASQAWPHPSAASLGKEIQLHCVSVDGLEPAGLGRRRSFTQRRRSGEFGPVISVEECRVLDVIGLLAGHRYDLDKTNAKKRPSIEQSGRALNSKPRLAIPCRDCPLIIRTIISQPVMAKRLPLQRKTMLHFAHCCQAGKTERERFSP